ncbi:MFS transporter [Amycolatopsis magusensis]|uniref:MFS transporter n=1 Tax=Amycolatopsis magusensis TaxID=882444 RepID=UPI0024A837DB|nr:MFS transporter [Amycolatopsis magusensis]MDI5978465.1 MFS transporter [Amycolatopsis magusensis]
MTSVGERAGRDRLAAGLTRGPVEVLDFFLPLWAGSHLAASAAEVGALTALETLVSFAVRPVAGALADRYDRGRLATLGAVLYGLSFVVYAVTPSMAYAYGAAVLGGAGGALFWVALRARVGEGLREDDGAFSKLFAAEGTGTWIAFIAAMSLVARVDYRGVFALGAAACLVAAVVLVRSGAKGTPMPDDAPKFRQLGGRLWPMLGLVVVTALAEAGVALLLLMHLQRGHQLELGEIAAVFLPGFIVYSVLPDHLHRVVRRVGRRKVLSLAMVCSAVFAAALSFAPSPPVLAVLWVLSAVAFAAAVPVEQAIVAEAAGVSLGRGMGIYEGATLLGATIGTFTAGLLYSAGDGWWVACLGAAGLLLGTSVLVPKAVARVGVVDRPVVVEPVVAAEPEPVPEPEPEPEPRAESKKPGWRNWAIHATVFVVAQVALAIAGYSWPLAALGSDDLHFILNDSGHWLLDAGRIWCLVFVVDTVWTGWILLRKRDG